MPFVECNATYGYPGLDTLYPSALQKTVDASTSGGDPPAFCPEHPSAANQIEATNCHTLLYHGRLHGPCLAARGLSVDTLPCVRSLLITSFPGSGSAAMARRLERVLTLRFNSVHESHVFEPDVLVSWLSRTDVWRLGATTCGLAVDESFYSR